MNGIGHVVLVLGAPGAVQCEFLQSEHGWHHIKAVELLTNRPDIPPGEVTPPGDALLGLIVAELHDLPAGANVLLEGFPSTLDQLEAFESAVRRISHALFLTPPTGVRGGETVLWEGQEVIERLEASTRATRITADASAHVILEAVRAVINGLQPPQPPPAPLPAAATAAAAAAAAPMEVAAALAPADPGAAAAPTDAAAGDAAAADAAAAAARADRAAAAAVEAAASAAREETRQAAVAAAAVVREQARQAAARAQELQALQRRVAITAPPLVVCGPSGAGKATLIQRLTLAHPEVFELCVSHTTRAARTGEVDEQHYHFTERAEMEAMVAGGAFLEHVEVHGDLYGTSLAAVAALDGGGDTHAEPKIAVLDINVEGARLVRKGPMGLRALFAFIAPQSRGELQARLRQRPTEAEATVKQRLADAEAEMAASREPGLFDLIILRNDLDAAQKALEALVRERVPGRLPPPSAEEAAAAAAAAHHGNLFAAMDVGNLLQDAAHGGQQALLPPAAGAVHGAGLGVPPNPHVAALPAAQVGALNPAAHGAAPGLQLSQQLDALMQALLAAQARQAAAAAHGAVPALQHNPQMAAGVAGMAAHNALGAAAVPAPAPAPAPLPYQVLWPPAGPAAWGSFAAAAGGGGGAAAAAAGDAAAGGSVAAASATAAGNAAADNAATGDAAASKARTAAAPAVAGAAAAGAEAGAEAAGDAAGKACTGAAAAAAAAGAAAAAAGAKDAAAGAEAAGDAAGKARTGAAAAAAGAAGAAAGAADAADGAAAAAAGAAATAASLLDFVYGGVPAGPAATSEALSELSEHQYLEATVMPTLRLGLAALHEERPVNPLHFLSLFLLRKAVAGGIRGASSSSAGGGGGV